MSPDDLVRHKVNSAVVQKTFTSSSKNPAVAREFVRQPKQGKTTAVFTFALNYPNTIYIDLAGMTAFEKEEEILILPLSLFIVTNVTRNESADGFTEVELRALSATATVESMIPNIGAVAAPVGYIASALKSLNPIGLTRGITQPFLDRYLNSDGAGHDNDRRAALSNDENYDNDKVDQSDGDGNNDDDPEQEPSENDDEDEDEEDGE